MRAWRQTLSNWWRCGLRRPPMVLVAWSAWAALLLWVAVASALGSKRTVVHNYRQAAVSWMTGAALYQDDGTGFLYLPQAAILSTPLTWGPPSLGESLWRVLNVGLLSVAVWRFAQMAGRRWAGLGSPVELFAPLTLITVPLAFPSAQNGQSTIIMTATMLLAVVALADRHWWTAAVWTSLGIALKPLAIVLALLIGALYRPLRLRLVLAFSIVLLLPFATQRADYVATQYRSFVEMLGTASAGGQSLLWAQAFDALSLAGVAVPGPAQTAIRLTAALGVLIWCGVLQRRAAAEPAVIGIFSLAVTYLVLLNPRTENCTYALIAPAIGVFYARACMPPRRPFAAVLLGLMALGTVGSYEFGRLVTAKEHAIWLAPLMAACFLMYMAFWTRELLRRNARGSDELPVSARRGLESAVGESHSRRAA